MTKLQELRLAVLRIRFHSGRPTFISPEAERAERIIASLMVKKGGLGDDRKVGETLVSWN